MIPQTTYDHNGVGEYGFFSSDEKKWINRIYKLKEQYPDEVEIIREPENNDGCIYCKLPRIWLKIKPPMKVELTDQQKAERAERLKNSQKLRELSRKGQEVHDVSD